MLQRHACQLKYDPFLAYAIEKVDMLLDVSEQFIH